MNLKTKYTASMSEYACRLRLIVSQTQVDFKAGEYINPAYITYIQDRVTKATLQEAKVQEITEIGRSNICPKDEPDQIGKGEGLVGNSDRHYVPGLPVEHPMTMTHQPDPNTPRHRSESQPCLSGIPAWPAVSE